ncbi:MAG: hypothetical protein ABIF40_05915 [archaeon]
MVNVEITETLFSEITKKFKKESVKILEHLKSLESNPKKGKELGTVGGILIKELKYKKFRFYFITDGFKLKCIGKNALIDLLFRFVRMSNKKTQQETINEIKHILKILGPDGLS